MAGKIDVQLLGSLIVLDIVLGVTRKGAGLLTDPVQISSTIATDVTATLNLTLPHRGARAALRGRD